VVLALLVVRPLHLVRLGMARAAVVEVAVAVAVAVAK
jgi:hypothetical protein